MRSILCIILLVGGVLNTLFGQSDRYRLEIELLDQEQLAEGNLAYETQFPDSLSVQKALAEILLQLQGLAYLEASFDKIIWQDSLVTARLHQGQTYRWAHLRNGNVDKNFLSRVGYRERLYNRQPFNYAEVVEMQKDLLDYAENNGYPFARVWLDSIRIVDGQVAAQIFMDKQKRIIFDALNIIGDARISTAYLEQYLGIQAGDLYDKSKVLKIRNRLRELPFLQEKQNVTVTFTNDKATVNLFLERKKASRFDFIFGFLPTNTSNIGQNVDVRRFQFTATFDAEMYNQFGLGERIYAQFEQLRPQTQELELEFAYPYVLNLPFGLDTGFRLYKRDTSYLDIESDLGVQYLMEGGNYLKAFWNRLSTNVLTVDENIIRQSRRLPSNLDVSNSTFGLEYNWQQLDYRFNPRRGWGTLLRGGAGVKTIKKNNAIVSLNDADDPSFKFESLYDTLELRTFQYRLSGQIAGYLPLFANSVIKGEARGGMIISENKVYQNEQFRIGGNRIMRGYDEESIFATNYAVFTLEYRLLIGQNSYLYTFADYGYVENITTAQRQINHPLGFGAGITFETGVGIFGFSLALGRLPDNTYDFRNLKTHFGYVSLF